MSKSFQPNSKQNQFLNAITGLPQFLRDLIACPPIHGNGVHHWLFKVARHLHHHRTPDEIAALLAAVVEDCGRVVPESEIREAVENSAKCAWQPGVASKPQGKKPQSQLNPDLRTAAITKSKWPTLSELVEASPSKIVGSALDAEWFIDQLFPGNPLLCVGRSKSIFWTKPHESFRGGLAQNALIVPSPMSKLSGARKKDGKPSAHTEDNTGPRHYLVTEFDSGITDEQVAIVGHLTDYAPLVMVLHSGGKSIHAWWCCKDKPEDLLYRFFRYALCLGADPATWSRSQFVRLPMGWRHEKSCHQEVHYFDHTALVEGGETK